MPHPSSITGALGLALAALAVAPALPPALSLARSQVLLAQTRNATIDAKSMFDARQPAASAAAMLKRDHRQTLDQAATILRDVGYAARALVPALRAEFTTALTPVYASLRNAGFPARDVADAFAGNLITLDCIDAQGFPIPCGNFGGLADAAPMGQVSWTPKPEGTTNGILQISAANLPPVFVRIGSHTLAEVSSSAGALSVRLPATPVTGPLTLTRKADNVSGLLQNDYRVESPPVPWIAYATAAADGANADMARWLSGAQIQSGCTVTGPLANAPIGHLTSSTGFANTVRSRLLAAGASSTLAGAWDQAFRSAFTTYTANVTIPSLPLFPTLAGVSAPSAPPVSNAPVPLGALVSVGALSMQIQTLGPAIAAAITPVSADDPARASAITVFANAVAARFNALLVQALLVNLKGGGPVPKYAPPQVGVAPVEGGSCSGTNVVLVPPALQ